MSRTSFSHSLLAAAFATVASSTAAAQSSLITDAACPVRDTTRVSGTTKGTPDSLARGAQFSVGRPDSTQADVALFAEATIGEIRFAAQPHIEVRLCGGLDSLHVLARRNLPDRIVPGTTYRNVYVAVEILGRVNADCITRQWLAATRPVTPSGSADSTSAMRASCASITGRARGDSVRRAP